MSLLEYLERDKEKVVTELVRAGSPEKAESVLLPELDRILYQYNEACTDERARLAAAQMMKTAGMALPLIDTAGETTVWERTVEGSQGQKRMSLWAWLLLVVGSACLIAGMVLGIAGGNLAMKLSISVYLLVLTVVGGISLFFAGRLSTRPPKGRSKAARGDGGGGYDPQSRWKTETTIDADKTYRILRSMMMLMDQNIEKAVPAPQTARRLEAGDGQAAGESADQGAGEMTKDLVSLDLICELLEASYSGDGVIALEKIEELKYALYQRGITLVDYAEETRMYFDVIPSGREATIRPALMEHGRVIRRGLAAGGM